MNSSLSVAIIAASTALIVTLVGGPVNIWVAQRDRNFFQVSRAAGPEEWKYAQTSTLFVIAEYLGWVEIMRRGIQFLDLGDDGQNRKLVKLFYDVERAFSTSRHEGKELRIHKTKQRAIGELIISSPDHEHGDNVCIGYATFCARLEMDSQFQQWFTHLQDDIVGLSNRSPTQTARLVELQNRLMDLIDFLDPQKIRFPPNRRDRLRVKYPGDQVTRKADRTHESDAVGDLGAEAGG